MIDNKIIWVGNIRKNLFKAMDLVSRDNSSTNASRFFHPNCVDTVWHYRWSFSWNFAFSKKTHFLYGLFFKSLYWICHKIASVLFCYFSHKACQILAPWPEIEPTCLTAEGEVLTPGPPGKFRDFALWISWLCLLILKTTPPVYLQFPLFKLPL